MHIFKPTLEPDEEFKTLQDLARKDPKPSLTEKLSALFAARFHLKFIYSSRARALSHLIEQAAKHLHDNFDDHSRVYKSLFYPDTHIVVVQPYGSYEEKTPVLTLLTDLGCDIADLRDWEFYYPGKAVCYGIVIHKAIAQALKFRQQKPPWSRDAAETVFSDLKVNL